MKEEIFAAITDHLLNDKTPSDYFNSLDKELNQYPLSMLGQLKRTEQPPKYHPEGSVWNHTMMVVNEAAKVKERTSDSKSFMWASLLHDIGKPDTTKVRKGRITSYEHDVVGARLTKSFLEFYNQDSDFVEKVSNMVKYHMHILYVLKGLPFGNPSKMVKETDIHDIALLCRCDRLGRMGADPDEEEKDYKKFLEIISSI